jgi:predicted  nucleic acid-binding Zn-ribbon protein
MHQKRDLNMGDRKAPGGKEDLKKFREEIVHQFHVISEDVISQVKQVGEGVVNVNEKLDRRFNELKAEIDNKTQPIAQAVTFLDGRVTSLDGKVTALDGKVTALDGKVTALDGKVTALDGKVDRIHQEIKKEIQETRQEVLAAVKFSYAELDRRLTLLENEFLELKRRIEKIESRSIS